MEKLRMGQRAKSGKYSEEFVTGALSRLEATGNVSKVARELGISHQLLRFWRDRKDREQHQRYVAAERKVSQENAQLRKALLKRTLEVDFFKTALQKIEALGRSNSGSGATASGKPSGN
jgi:transposase-like protein